MLPFIVLRRIDLVLATHKENVLKLEQKLQAGIKAAKSPDQEETLRTIRKQRLAQAALPGQSNQLYNTSSLDWEKITQQTTDHATNLVDYLNAFSPEARQIFARFELEAQVLKLAENNLLYLVMKEFERPEVDLHPDRVSNLEMGYVFEDLVRRFNEQANEEAGDHFTPREVIELMTNLVYDAEQESDLFTPGIFRKIYDPTCGTGGMLSESETTILERNPDANLELYGQEYNPESWAICQSDMLIKQERISNIAFGDTLGNGKTTDAFPNEKFHYMLANPPFGVDWKKQKKTVEEEYQKFGFDGRFGAGLPAITDGALLFLQHMLSKMVAPPEAGDSGSKIAVVFNGSPLFTGDAGSGPSNIRRYVIENDWLDTIVALPDQLFYNTGIYTYVWIVTNRKPARRRGKVQLINATRHFEKMGKSLGNKRNQISTEQIQEISRLYSEYDDNATANVLEGGKQKERIVGKLLDNREFGFLKVTVERPLRLHFDFAAANLAKLATTKAFQNLAASKKRNDAEAAREINAGRAFQAQLLDLATTLADDFTTKNRPEALKKLKAAVKVHGLKLTAQLRAAILDVTSTSDPTADICYNSKGDAEPDTSLRDTELIPFPSNIPLPLPIGYDKKDDLTDLIALVETHCEAYLDKEVRPHVGEAWIDYAKTKVGYEIPINRHFYVYEPPRPLSEIEKDMKTVEGKILELLRGL
jgi:type I restriction enzyme M protein